MDILPHLSLQTDQNVMSTPPKVTFVIPNDYFLDVCNRLGLRSTKDPAMHPAKQPLCYIRVPTYVETPVVIPIDATWVSASLFDKTASIIRAKPQLRRAIVRPAITSANPDIEVACKELGFHFIHDVRAPIVVAGPKVAPATYVIWSADGDSKLPHFPVRVIRQLLTDL